LFRSKRLLGSLRKKRRLRKSPQQRRPPVLHQLSQTQLELALRCLAEDQTPQFLPEELLRLSPLDWMLLEQLLNNLMWEQQYSQMH
jgi:hypothetical protein